MINNEPSLIMGPGFDRKKFKEAIAYVESSGGKYLSNKTSSAAGRYHFLYRYIKGIPELKGISKLEFINSPELQEKIMDMALDGNLQGFPNYIDYANVLKTEFDTNLEPEEVAALVHFLGKRGAKRYFKNTSGFKVPGKNATVDQYLERFRSAYKPDTPRPKKTFKKQEIDAFPQTPTPKGKPAPGVPTTSADIGPPQPRKFIETEYNAIGEAPGDAIDLLQNPLAYGGEVQQRDGSAKDLVRFDEGGTHEQNPHGGLPIGNGNTVEEGETKFKFNDGDYVFSNRIGMYCKGGKVKK